MSRVTIRDVARRAGVSASAVSRVFGDGQGVTEATRDRVQAAADQLGYRPNALARGLIHSSIDLVAVVIGRMRSAFDSRFLEELTRGLAAHGLRTLLIPADEGAGDAPLLTALDWQVAATVVAAGTLPKTTIDSYARFGIPLIMAGSSTVGGLEGAPEIDSVMSQNAEGTRAATDLLVRSGCRRVAYFGLSHRPQSDQEREAGVRAALEGAGLSLDALALADSHAGTELDQAMDLLGAFPAPDGVVCATDSLAFVVIEAARRLCLRVPQDLSIVGFDDLPQSSWSVFDLTTLRYPVEDLAAWIVARILERRSGTVVTPVSHRIPIRLIPRGTTRSLKWVAPPSPGQAFSPE
ncbi:MAG: LacI family transcriptional regulator [Rhodospirillum sp.]|nr:LacI family transcriptional regulator [Rhodospirillum sp.]MCF8488342.1 LacI family transcriptional regulator [Rhodospirillum sp.]MCF8502621.1 LacI family transcriptional regulator [Rhodospirillum sp.]